jgi:hypothetical protein
MPCLRVHVPACISLIVAPGLCVYVRGKTAAPNGFILFFFFAAVASPSLPPLLTQEMFHVVHWLGMLATKLRSRLPITLILLELTQSSPPIYPLPEQVT